MSESKPFAERFDAPLRDESNSKIGPGILGYATPGVEQVADVLPVAERLIGQGHPPSAIRECFSTAREAVRYFAQSMSRRYSTESLGEACASCGAVRPTCVIRASWIAVIPPRTLEVRASSGSVNEKFHTFHALCPECFVEWTNVGRRYRRAKSIHKWLGTLPTIVLICFFVAENALPDFLTRTRYLYVALFCSVLALGALRWHGMHSVRKRQPEALKRVAREGVQFDGLSGAFSLSAEGLRSLT